MNLVEVIEVTKECLLDVASQIEHGYVQCLLCGEQATDAGCWIPQGADAVRLHVPINRQRVIGYGLCRPCRSHLTEIETQIISERLSAFVLATYPHMDRGKFPAIFLN